MRGVLGLIGVVALAGACSTASSPDGGVDDAGDAELDAGLPDGGDGEPTVACQEVPDGGIAGAVLLRQIPRSLFFVAPHFPYDPPWYPPPFACTMRCRIMAGVLGDAGLGSDSGVGRNLGTLTISGLAVPDVVLPPRVPGYYGLLDQTTRFAWQGGETISITATGDPSDVPGFSGAVTGPTVVSLAPIGSSHAIGAPLELSWTAEPGSAAAGVLRFTLEGTATHPNPWGRARVECDFPVELGHGVVPSSVLAELQPTPFASWTAGVHSTATATSAAGLVHLGAESSIGGGGIELR